MKKLSALLIPCFLMAYSHSSAQLFVGAELGSNVIQMEETDLSQPYELGVHAGPVISYSFNDNFALSTSFMFSQKSKAYSTSSSTPFLEELEFFGFGIDDLLPLDSATISGIDMNQYTETNTHVRQLYLEIPVMAEYRVANFRFFGGPYAGFLLSAKTTTQEHINIPLLQVIDISSLDPTGGLLSLFLPPGETNTLTESTYKEGLNTFDYGFNAGVGYMMNNVSFQLSYSRGFTDFRSEQTGIEGEPQTEFDDDPHQLFRVSVAYLFNLGKQTEGDSMY